MLPPRISLPLEQLRTPFLRARSRYDRVVTKPPPAVSRPIEIEAVSRVVPDDVVAAFDIAVPTKHGFLPRQDGWLYVPPVRPFGETRQPSRRVYNNTD